MQPIARRRPGRPPASKSADTRERIIRVAREVFSELGYDAATFQAIAVRADLTRPAINHYFSSKIALYREVLARTNDFIVVPAIQRAHQETGLVERLSSFIVSAVQANAEERSAGAFLVVAAMESKRHPELRPAVDALLSPHEFLNWVVTDAVQRGELGTDTDIASLVEMLTAVMWGIGFYAGFVGSQQQVDAVATNLPLLLGNRLWQLNPSPPPATGDRRSA